MGANFINWYHNLRIVHMDEKKEYVLDQLDLDDLPYGATAAAPELMKSTTMIHSKLDVSLLQIRPFVPVPQGHLSRFWNRDSPSGTKSWTLLSRVAEPGQNIPHAKKFFAPRGIRSQGLLSSTWFSC